MFGILWIYITDYLLGHSIQDPIIFTKIQYLKGWIFVTASAILIYLLFWNYLHAQQKAEDTLRESEEKFRYVFEAANVGKSIASPTGEFSANKAFADMLGYTREELAKKNWQSITPTDEMETTRILLAPLIKEEKDSARFNKR